MDWTLEEKNVVLTMQIHFVINNMYVAEQSSDSHGKNLLENRYVLMQT